MWFVFTVYVIWLFISPVLRAQHSISDDESRMTERFLGQTYVGAPGVEETTASIMVRQKNNQVAQKIPRKMHNRYIDSDRENRPTNPDSLPIDCYPLQTKEFFIEQEVSKAPQTLNINFTGASLSDSGFFPPDSMGAVGPNQFVIAINGLIRSFDKSTGLADGVLNVDPDVFFNSIRNGHSTSDPRIRYDRLSGRWIVIMINVPPNEQNNRLLIAVSNDSIITPSTMWTFFYFNVGAQCFLDYPTLGVDNNALYIGGKTFCSDNNNSVFVIQKSSVLGGGPIVITRFDNLINQTTGVGPYVPQGVDNFDTSASVGYFVGVDNASFGKLIIRRIFNPGGAPTISGNISLTVPATQFPLLVRHLGNNNGVQGRLDAIDDRLFMAHIRNGRLWTAHNIGVNNEGVAARNRTRNGCRWYEININSSTPTLIQAGTLFQPSQKNLTNKRSYWMPSLMTSGQGHMALGCSVAGSQLYANTVTAGRLANDSLGLLRSAILCTSSTTAYNPPGDPGDAQRGRRWGDYSYTSLDPCDDMTFWTIQEFCNATNSWGARVTQLLAPPPATPNNANPSSIAQGNSSVNVTITGISVNGSGFYDPGAGFDCRLDVSISGGVTVNSVSYQNPTTVVVNVSTVGASTGSKNVMVTNPDGQSKIANGLITITVT